MPDEICAHAIRVRGVVQGVGFRPFVFRLARANALAGWVLNEEGGVEIHVEGKQAAMEGFLRDLKASAPPAAVITTIEVIPADPLGMHEFTIRASECRGRPAARISPDLPVCSECLSELFDPSNERYLYPYVNCTACGPRYSILLSLPYDRGNTTMQSWAMDTRCSAQYHDPGDRRFHAQPVACADCGPHYRLRAGTETTGIDSVAITRAAQLLTEGKIVAVKGLGGFHLACNATDPTAVNALRERKFRKEKPFALMVRDLDVARGLAKFSRDDESLLVSLARPIVLVPGRKQLDGVAPETDELGIMLPYTPLHYLLFASGAPAALVMTSANRSSEPIAYRDDDAFERLDGIADAFLVGERPIARRVDDSVARAGAVGTMILRRARGYAPGAVAGLRTGRPILAAGADLKNTITLVVDGEAIVSQHIGDLDHYEAFRAFEETIRDLLKMYDLDPTKVMVAHDSHPQYASTGFACGLGERRISVQHHRAHIASVLAEQGEWDRPVLGVAFDGTGYGDDGTIWGGECFAGSLRGGFERVAHLRSAALAGGDAGARDPVLASAGFLSQVGTLPNLCSAPFNFPPRYLRAVQLVEKGVRTFQTTSVGRLFDTVAALLGFTRPMSYEGQAAVWLEHLARQSRQVEALPLPLAGCELDFRGMLESVVQDRVRGREPAAIARAFHRGLAEGLACAAADLCSRFRLNTVVLSGGVFQNELLLEDLRDLMDGSGFEVWTNHAVPPNDGGISLGQAAIASVSHHT
ncbi:MAG TPA: carbamoyltransferase HypF [Terriglobales bacterium]|nr:carbamoyltransferase HypF [Terriglobales bacterium]